MPWKYIIKGKNKNIIWLTYHQGKVFERFKENAKSSKASLPFSV